jgi:hydroxylamine dehydrogenase
MKSPKSAGAAILIVALTAGFSFAASSAPPEPNAQMPPLQLKEYRIERAISETAAACIQCHADQTKGIVADWAASRHAHANVNCLDCHAAGPADTDASAAHLTFDKTRIAPIVSPKDCSRCHPAEAAQYAKSKHANTLEIIWKIDPWLNHGMNNDTERTTGCFPCHGAVIEPKEGRLDAAVWPNVGVGRLNPDGSKGSCTSCHTRHKFSVAEARKPEACGQCHL